MLGFEDDGGLVEELWEVEFGEVEELLDEGVPVEYRANWLIDRRCGRIDSSTDGNNRCLNKTMERTGTTDGNNRSGCLIKAMGRMGTIVLNGVSRNNCDVAREILTKILLGQNDQEKLVTGSFSTPVPFS